MELPWAFVSKGTRCLDSALWQRDGCREGLLKVPFVRKACKRKEGCSCSGGFPTALPILWSEGKWCDRTDRPLSQRMGPWPIGDAGTHRASSHRPCVLVGGAGRLGCTKSVLYGELVLAVRVWEKQGFGTLLACEAERRPALHRLAVSRTGNKQLCSLLGTQKRLNISL